MELQQGKITLYIGEDKYVSKYHTPLVKTEGSLERVAEYTSLQSVDPSAEIPKWKGEAVGNEQSATRIIIQKSVKVKRKNHRRYVFQAMLISQRWLRGTDLLHVGLSLSMTTFRPQETIEGHTSSLLPLQDGEATTGEYATNLAESVLQDAFIRLSKSQPALPRDLQSVFL